MIQINNPTYNSTTNKIDAYLLPDPNGEDYMINKQISFDEWDLVFDKELYESDKLKWQNSKIEISVDNELRGVIIGYILKLGVFKDLTPIMDSIEVSNNCCGRCIEGMDECKITYIAKLKQVDKVEVVEESGYYPLFKFFFDEHNLNLLESEIQDIIHYVELYKPKPNKEETNKQNDNRYR